MTRTSADISRGLAAARIARPITPGTRIHVAGRGRGRVVGCRAPRGGGRRRGDRLRRGRARPAHRRRARRGDPDRVASRRGARPRRRGASGRGPARGHQGGDVGATRIIPSWWRPARPGIEPESVQQVIADAAATGDRRLIGVTGTHGKSTTSGWILHILAAPGATRRGSSGACLPAGLAGPTRGVARIGAGPDFVVEADEYAGNFDPYRPRIAVLISAEWDHPDVFASEEAVVETFAGLDRPPRTRCRRTPDPGRQRRRHGRRAGPRCAGAVGWATRPRPAGTGGRRPGGPGRGRRGHRSVVAEDGDGTDLEITGLRGPDDPPDRVRIGLIGRHLAIDGLMAAGGALAAGVDADAILAGLASYEGVGRRFELKGEVGGVDRPRRLRPPPDGDAPDVRAPRGSGTRTAACGPSTSR